MFSVRLFSRITNSVQDQSPSSARRSRAARFLLIFCFFLCGVLLLYQAMDYCLSLRHHDSVTVFSAASALSSSAPVQRFYPLEPEADGEQKMDINLASLSDLTRASGIGPVLAQKILDYRDSIGGFRFIEELTDVSGIGEKRFEALCALFFCPAP